MSWQQPDELPRNHVYHTDNERTEAHIAQGYVVGDASGQGSLPYENQSCQYGEGGAEIEWQFAECEIVERSVATPEKNMEVYMGSPRTIGTNNVPKKTAMRCWKASPYRTAAGIC